MGDLDVSLIREFSLRPAFYNKANPHFKDKSHNEQAWAEISAKLGYDVMLLKDRIYQLRNRYNLEKRKVEALRAEGLGSARSSWPLFGNLTFLDGHIRPRKSYKSMMRRTSHDQPHHERRSMHRRDSGLDDPKTHYVSPTALQQMVQIKYEDGTNDDSDVVLYQNGYDTEDDRRPNGNYSHSSQGDDPTFINPATFLVDDKDSDSDNHPGSDDVQMQQKQPTNSAGSISLRNINSLKRRRSKSPTGHSGTNASMSNHNHHTGFHPNDCDSQNSSFNRTPVRVRTSADKFEAFGSFVVSSLTDLPERKALELVENFTSEIVKALLSKENDN